MIKAIFATDIEGGMGKNGTLPWPFDKEDMKRFKDETTGHIVVMGSNTWLDPMMPKPLPRRKCIVVSNQPVEMFKEADDVIAGFWLRNSLEYLLDHYKGLDIWIIGGAKLLMSCRPYIQEIHLTTFMQDYDCDVKIYLDDYLKDFTRHNEWFGRNKTNSIWTRRNAELSYTV